MQDQSLQLEVVTPRVEELWDLFSKYLVQSKLVPSPEIPEELQKWTDGQKRYIILYKKKPIGITTLTGQDGRCFFGYGILPGFQGLGLAEYCLQKITETAKSLGYTTMTTKVARDDPASIHSRQQDGYREFKWFEKNLEAVTSSQENRASETTP